jgi:hypothetical protein
MLPLLTMQTFLRALPLKKMILDLSTAHHF